MTTSEVPFLITKELAQAVVLRAFEDAVAPKLHNPKTERKRQQDRIDGREFLLRDTEDLRFWCDRAEINPDVINAGARRLAAKKWKRPIIPTTPPREAAHDDGF